jgi:hypothetical protein
MGERMPEIDAKLKAVFGKGSKAAPIIPPVKMPPKPKRYLEDISIAIQAQRIYDPAKPPAPATKAPTAAMLEQGTTPAMKSGGAWGKTAKRE